MPNDDEKILLILEDVKKYERTKGISGISSEEALGLIKSVLIP